MAATDTTTPDAALTSEYETLTKRCGIVDRSERGKLTLTGPGAVEFLNGQVTNELVGLSPDEGCYAAFLTHKGKMLGDLRILAVAGTEQAQPAAERPHPDDRPATEPSELLLDSERCALQALFDMIRRFKVGYDVELHKRTLECSLLSLIGPDADAIATKAFALDDARLPTHEHSHLLAHLGQTPVRLIRTDLGIDALFEAGALAAAREALEAAGAVSVSEAAAEIVRVEHGRPRYGIDLDESTIPQEAGLNERAVSFTKGCYVGQETVARLHYKGKPNRHLRGLLLSEPAESGAALALGERAIGSLSSSVLSPRLGPIGLALVRREAEPGTTVSVGELGASAVVVELPFA
ncbi:MAG TPA: glycine cleavage T C-terminal barrel domain-containing protein [Solirubrobacteraceae bacterium]|nr:glycine cleavage T C-terminal barrel domain-containing protein [Solirubrobacteraceae bacterium]